MAVEHAPRSQSVVISHCHDCLIMFDHKSHGRQLVNNSKNRKRGFSQQQVNQRQQANGTIFHLKMRPMTERSTFLPQLAREKMLSWCTETNLKVLYRISIKQNLASSFNPSEQPFEMETQNHNNLNAVLQYHDHRTATGNIQKVIQ